MNATNQPPSAARSIRLYAYSARSGAFHSSGPWEVRPGKTGDLKIYMEGAKASGGAVASIRVPSGSEHTATCNARLMALAPELLESLEWALRRINTSGLGEGEQFTRANSVVDRATA